MSKLFEAIDNLYESTDKLVLAEEEHEFNGIAFEKSIPDEMRFKSWDIIDNGSALYWVTQQHYTEDQLREFTEALKNTEFRKAYVTVRDNSTYEWADDNQHGVLDVITIDGDGNANIESCGKNQWVEPDESVEESENGLEEVDLDASDDKANLKEDNKYHYITYANDPESIGAEYEYNSMANTEVMDMLNELKTYFTQAESDAKDIIATATQDPGVSERDVEMAHFCAAKVQEIIDKMNNTWE